MYDKRLEYLIKYTKGVHKKEPTKDQKEAMFIWAMQELSKTVADSEDEKFFTSAIVKLNMFPFERFKHVYRRKFLEDLGGGNAVICPTCSQHSKIYKRKINTNMCIFLESLYVHFNNNQDWIHYKKCEYTSRDYSYIEHWGLAETKSNTEKTKKSSGYWRITEKGLMFIQNKTLVPKYNYIYNGNVIASSDARVTYTQARTNKFDIREL